MPHYGQTRHQAHTGSTRLALSSEEDRATATVNTYRIFCKFQHVSYEIRSGQTDIHHNTSKPEPTMGHWAMS